MNRMLWVILGLCATAPPLLAHDKHEHPTPLRAGETRVLVATSFEEGEETPEITDHSVSTEHARTGRRSISGEVEGKNQACWLRLPFDGGGPRRLTISFYVYSETASQAAVWWNWADGTRSFVGNLLNVGPEWVEFHSTMEAPAGTSGEIEVVAPTSYDGPPSRIWLDDLRLTVTGIKPFAAATEEFPALTIGGDGTRWVAAQSRDETKQQTVLIRNATEPSSEVRIELPSGATAVGEPALAAWKEGYLLVFPLERDDRWTLAVAEGGHEGAGALREAPAAGRVDMAPAVAASDSAAWIVSESNGGGIRTIQAVRYDGGFGEPVTLSSTESNSANPDIVALGDGRFFAAWDSVRNHSADLYGAWFVGGNWQREERLTSASRIERHVALATRDGVLWMSWQAQSHPGWRLNHLDEQRIVVARLERDGAKTMPRAMFDAVSTAERLLVRPRIAVDPAGRLWLTVRRSLGQNDGWEGLCWRLAGDEWKGPFKLWTDFGRWHAIPIAFDRAGTGYFALERDNIPPFANVGDFPDWRRDVVVAELRSDWYGKEQPAATGEFMMPPTDFDLGYQYDFSNSHHPRRKRDHAGRELTLFWGDLHEHSSISVCARAFNPPPADLYANQRDIELLDFTAITDHGYNIDNPFWGYLGETARKYHDEGSFVTFLAEEWTSDHVPYDPPRDYKGYGHRNLIFEDPYADMFFDSRDGEHTPEYVWGKLEKAGLAFVCVPHQLADTGNVPTNWAHHDEYHQPLAEIWQARRSYEYLGAPQQSSTSMNTSGHYLQDAWKDGIVIGVIASPDHGGGRGKAGVWAEELTRKSLFEAFRARHTYGTSGRKMTLWFGTGESMMGDTIQHRAGEPITFDVQGEALSPINEVVIFRDGDAAWRVTPGSKRIDRAWTDERSPTEGRSWYYLRFQTEDGELAWSSPIWVDWRK